MRLASLAALLVHVGLIACQDVKWCKDEKCADCPSGLASSGPGYPECVVYDSNTVFGGQGFNEDTVGDIKFKVFGDFKAPCGGQPGNYMIRSPASLDIEGCGNLIFSTTKAQCSAQMGLQDTFMIQFCCGSGDCDKAHVPIGTRGIDFMQAGGGGSHGVYLQYENGTIIEPLAIGSPPSSSAAASRPRRLHRRCKGYKDGSYVADGDIYYKTFETVVASANVPAEEEERTFTFQHTRTASKTTTFETSVGDPWGVISISTGVQWQDATSKSEQISIVIPAGQSGYIGWTPFFRCTKGTLEDCDGKRTEEHESCAPYVDGDVIRGDYAFVQT
ncbi:hypothetical protein PG985_009688 [Apiospora marii]|uniref:Uncharacterized protein n=1 Tax=Apiospora marii TaxID=335849 RepID=A0ABR1RGD2_9PEZI